MTMPCRITDEKIINPFDLDDNSMTIPITQTLEDLTLHELMGSDHNIWMKKDDKFGFNIQIENEEGQSIIEEQVHPFAIESMASFCRQFLYFYEKSTQLIHE